MSIKKLIKASDPYATADAVNHAGQKAWNYTEEEAYRMMVFLNLLGNTYYVAEKEMIQQTLDLHQTFIKNNPKKAAAILVDARNNGFMRMQPIVGLAFLSKVDTQLFQEIFPQIIKTPGDLQDFVEFVRSIRGLGSGIKKAINDFLNKLSPYHVIKYQSGGQGYSLRDIVRLTHPYPTEQSQGIFAYLKDSSVWADKYWDSESQLAGLELYKAAETDNERVQYIKKYRLPWEIVTGIGTPSPAIWKALQYEMPVFALLRNLNTLQRHGVLDVDYVAKTFASPEIIRKAKILPFRVFSAYKMFVPKTRDEQRVLHALEKALDSSELPAINGKVAIAIDCSGSMVNRVSDKSDILMSDIAAILGAKIVASCDNPLVIKFIDRAQVVKLSPNDSVMTNMGKLSNLAGGTDLGSPIRLMIANKEFDINIFVGVTDSEDWAGHGFLRDWEAYKQKNPKAIAILVQLAPYMGTRVAPPNNKDIYYVFGWGDQVVNLISELSNR